MLKQEIQGSFVTKIGYLLCKSAFKTFKQKTDPSEYGGAPLLGIGGAGIVCHGSSDPVAISIAIRQAGVYAEICFEEKLAKLL